MNTEALLQILLQGNQLKRTIRTGWSQRGVVQPESVAAHSFGVVFIALVLAETIDESFNLASVLAMAALHDLPEGLTTDIPTPAWRFLPQGAKESAERQAMMTMIGATTLESRFMAWWEESLLNQTPESHLVHDADKLDQFLQAYLYERQTGNQQLAEFWSKPHRFRYPEAQRIYDELRRRRDQTTDRSGSLTAT